MLMFMIGLSQKKVNGSCAPQPENDPESLEVHSPGPAPGGLGEVVSGVHLEPSIVFSYIVIMVMTTNNNQE